MTETESPKRMGRFWSSFDERVDANSVGTLALRVIIGTIFFMNETAVLGWFNGQGGLAGKKEFITFLGYDPVTPITWLLLITEIVTGVLLILGFATPWHRPAPLGSPSISSSIWGGSKGSSAARRGPDTCSRPCWRSARSLSR